MGISAPSVPRLLGDTVPRSAEGFCWEDGKQADGCAEGLRPPALETQPVGAHRHQHRTENSHLEALWPQVGLKAEGQGRGGMTSFADKHLLANGFCEGPDRSFPL